MKITYSPPAVEVNHIWFERNILNTVLNSNSSPGSTDADMDIVDADSDLWG